MITYNHEKFIQEAIEGVLMQQCDFEIELIVANDCSTDKTDAVIQNILKNHPRANWIKYTNHPINKGMMPNFIWALQQCKGKYIALCEGDDYWTDPLKLQKQVDFLEKNEEYVLCFHPCDLLISTSKVKPYIQSQDLDRINYEYTIKNLLINWNIPTASMIFRNFEDELPQWVSEVASGDIALAMILFKKGKFKLLKEWMSVYRINGSGISSQHVGYKMIHKRAFLYYHLNNFFNFKYEQDIYDALNQIYIIFSNQEELKSINKLEQSFFKRVIKKIYKKIKQNWQSL